jgi:hypothetical protein
MDVPQLVEVVIREIVDYPDQVSCLEVVGSRTCILELTVDPRDVGKVIGRGGSHADALRTLLAAVGGKRKMRYTLEIPEDRNHQPHREHASQAVFHRKSYQRKQDDS